MLSFPRLRLHLLSLSQKVPYVNIRQTETDYVTYEKRPRRAASAGRGQPGDQRTPVAWPDS
jgi:hypothetical protein